MKIVLSGLPPKDIVQEISSYLNIKEKPSVIMQRSADPPSVIQIIGSVIDWLDPFKISALAVIAEISKLAAKDIYNNRTRILKAFGAITVKPIRDFANLLFKSKEKNGSGRTQVIVSLNIPDDYIGTSLELKLHSEGELAWQFANFILRIENIESLINNLMKTEKPPMVPISIIINEDGSTIIKYMDKLDLQMHEIVVE